MTYIPGPFRVKCLLCNTQIESWHRNSPAPEGATIDMVYCPCGNVWADGAGFVGYGRFGTDDLETIEVENPPREEDLP